MIRLVLLVVVAIAVFMIITQPETSGQHTGEIAEIVGVWLKDVLTATLKLIKDTIVIFQSGKEAKG